MEEERFDFMVACKGEEGSNQEWVQGIE